MKKVGFIIIVLLFNINVYAKETVILDKCVDGDTAWFIYNNESSKFRFLAIDTPESTTQIEEFGKEASSYTCDQLKKASKIEIEFDPNSHKQDKYDRYLAWIFVDGELLQEKIIENGYAEINYIYGDYKYLDDLKKTEQEAKEHKKGIYSNNNEEDINSYDKLFIIIGIVIIIIFFIFDKNYRKKYITKMKSKAKKKIKSTIKKIR